MEKRETPTRPRIIPTTPSLEIPAELWSEIVKHLAPHDILWLSQTCQTLHTILSCKSVWIPILRSVCRENELFLPSYPVDAMDVGQIQRASLGPYLWEKKLATYRAHDDLHGGDQFELLAPTSRHPFGNPMNRDQYFLVPGGRFLVSVNSMTLSVWDLGVMGCFAAHPLLVAEIGLVEAENEQYDVDNFDFSISYITVQRVGNDHLRIALTISQQVLIARVYEIDLTKEDADLKKLHSLHLSALGIDIIWGLLIDGDRLLIAVEELYIMLWDYATDRYIVWSPGNLGDNPEITIIGDLIVHLSSKGVATWPIPALSTPLPTTGGIASFDDLISQFPTQVHVVPFNERMAAPEHGTSFLLPSTWYHKTRIPFTFDAIRVDKATKVYRFMLSLDHAEQAQVKVTWLASLDLIDMDRRLYTVGSIGSLELGSLGTTVLRTYQAKGRPHRPRGTHRSYLFSAFPGLQTDQKTQQDSPSPVYGSATCQLTAISDETPVSISLCTASGILVEVSQTFCRERKIYITSYL